MSYTTMPPTLDKIPPTLVTIPAEIRNAIFGLLLPSPSDRITMERKTQSISSKPHALIYHEQKDIKNQPISVALLRTCKQIREECKGILDWSQYTFVFNTSRLAGCVDEIENFPTLPFKHIRDMELHYDPYQDHLDGVECLRLLGRCVEQGSLKSFTIQALYEGNALHGNGRIWGQQICGQSLRFRVRSSFLGHNGELTKLKKRPVIPENLFRLFLYIISYRPVWLFAGIAEAMHQILGGELWVGDTCCWVNRVRVGTVPELKRE